MGRTGGRVAKGRAGTTGRRKRAWSAPVPLPLQVGLVASESTGSLVGRVAALNGLPLNDLMDRVGAGTRPMPVQSTEVYLNPAALQRLAVLSGYGVPELQRALPHLRSHHLLPDGLEPVWEWPQWQVRDPLFLVRACDLCTAARGRPSDVYLVSVTRWRVCVRHRRWLDNLREAGTTWLVLDGLPEVVEAHRQRVMLERRLGSGGRALFADALHIAAAWWNVPAVAPPVWAARRRLLAEPVGSDLRIAPLVCYPEVVQLALLLAVRERRRMRGTWGTGTETAWQVRVAATIEGWRMPVAAGMHLFNAWVQRHSTPLAAGALRPAQGRWRPLPALPPHAPGPPDTLLENLTCLPWRFGDEPPRPDITQTWSVAGQA
ncbi:TniQ family protein [Streptomyces sp. NPDC003860]